MSELENNAVMNLLARFNPKVVRITKNGKMIFYGSQ